MAVTERTVRNKRNSAGELTGKAGTVYDVNVKYKSGGKSKTYSRKGFLTKKDALQHEAEMKAKLTNPAYTPPSAVQRKMTVQEYMTEWIDRHGSANLRPSTEASYRSHMKNHIFPYIGDVFLNQLSPEQPSSVSLGGGAAAASSCRRFCFRSASAWPLRKRYPSSMFRYASSPK